jgi:NTP pyrophosphatase (non-canonical NTP hydrolase)
MNELSIKVKEWADNRNLVHRDNVPKQMMKVIEELGELNQAILKHNQDGIIDGIGDVLVTIIILSNQLGYSPEHCLGVAYNEISKRTGQTINGVFIKDTQ